MELQLLILMHILLRPVFQNSEALIYMMAAQEKSLTSRQQLELFTCSSLVTWWTIRCTLVQLDLILSLLNNLLAVNRNSEDSVLVRWRFGLSKHSELQTFCRNY